MSSLAAQICGLGVRALLQARVELARGIRETTPNAGPEIDTYAPRCLRKGQVITVKGLEWCARFASEMVWRAATRQTPAPVSTIWTPAISNQLDWPPFAMRAAVAEIWADAVACGVAVKLQDAVVPVVGDLLVMGRGGQDPRHGGRGHIAFIDEIADEGGWWAIGGNEGDAVRRTWRTPDDTAEPIVGWIALR